MSYDYSNFVRNAEKALRAQTRAVPASHGSHHNIVGAYKAAIQALVFDQSKDAERLEKAITESWEELLNAPLPAHMVSRFQSNSIQEYVKLLGVQAKYRYMVGRAEAFLPLPEWKDELQESGSSDSVYGRVGSVGEVPIQSYFAGLEEIPGELSNLLGDYLVRKNLTLEERVQAFERFLECAKEICDFLGDILAIERVSEALLSTSERPNYHETFKGRLEAIGDIVTRRQDQLIDMLNTRAVILNTGVVVTEGLAGGAK